MSRCTVELLHQGQFRSMCCGPGVATVTMGCAHEHFETSRVCEVHLAEAQDPGDVLTCTRCRLAGCYPCPQRLVALVDDPVAAVGS